MRVTRDIKHGIPMTGGEPFHRRRQGIVRLHVSCKRCTHMKQTTLASETLHKHRMSVCKSGNIFSAMWTRLCGRQRSIPWSFVSW